MRISQALNGELMPIDQYTNDHIEIDNCKPLCHFRVPAHGPFQPLVPMISSN